ncbi:hypothetical protein ACFVVX_24540 [Kitasatospora sp. NPDC058170]|uniref:hypothetical protein n=1 Tax=Kitasatospora sp. NPDC058170 TaxID=3346364 RepID=UPI0036DB315C
MKRPAQSLRRRTPILLPAFAAVVLAVLGAAATSPGADTGAGRNGNGTVGALAAEHDGMQPPSGTSEWNTKA